MEKTIITEQEMHNYLAPEITVLTLETNAIMLNASTAITSESEGFDDLIYGGYDDNGEGD